MDLKDLKIETIIMRIEEWLGRRLPCAAQNETLHRLHCFLKKALSIVCSLFCQQVLCFIEKKLLLTDHRSRWRGCLCCLLKGVPKKNLHFQNLICIFLVNRWSQEAVILTTCSTNEYYKSWEGHPLWTNALQRFKRKLHIKFLKWRFFLVHPLLSKIAGAALNRVLQSPVWTVLTLRLMVYKAGRHISQ